VTSVLFALRSDESTGIIVIMVNTNQKLIHCDRQMANTFHPYDIQVDTNV